MNASQFASVRRILIVKPSSLGDIVHTLPLLALMRQHARPDAEIRWLVNETWAPLLRGHPLLDGVIEFPRQVMRGWRAPGRFVTWMRNQADWRPDVAVDVQGLLRSLVLARALRPALLAGYSDAREGAQFGFDEVIDARVARSPHAVDRYLTFAEALGWQIPDPLPFPLPAAQRPSDAGDLPERFVLLHPFSRGQGKSLRAAQVDRLCAGLGEIPVVIAGRLEESGWRPAARVGNWLNRTTLPELVWLLQRSSWTVSVDSGPMHLAAAVSSRVLSLHTWSDPLKVGPYPGDAWAWKGGEFQTMAQWRRLGSGPERPRGEGDFPDEAVESVAGFVRERWNA